MSFIYKKYKQFSVDTVAHEYIKNHINEYVELSGTKLEELQKCLLEMLEDIHRTCMNNSIDYALTGGNVLGKVRHNGFIPWDDDIDLIMMREDYEKFKKIFYSSELVDKYLLRGPGCKEGADYRCMKVYKRNSVMEQAFHKQNVQKKVFIDIMPFDYVPDSKTHRRIKGMYCSFLVAALGCVDFRKNFSNELKSEMKKTRIGRINYALRSIMGFIFGIIPLHTWYNLYDRAPIYNHRTKYGTVFNGKLLYIDEIVPVDYYFPFADCDYCGIKSRIIHKPEQYLSFRYGDYLKIPKIEDRETHIVKRVETNITNG